MTRLAGTALASLAVAGVLAATVSAAPGARVATFGPSDAGRVLVLVPGLGAGAGALTVLAQELVIRVPNLQVWTVDRRTDALEDTLGFATGEPGTVYRYYFEGLAFGGRTFNPDLARTTTEARGWGLAVSLADLRVVVQRARSGGRRVLLGGHSLGAATALAYAAWDFGGRPGHRDLAGLVLVDGGQLGTFGRPTVPQARTALAALATTQPFEDRLGIGVPWLFGVFGQLAAMHALWAPGAPSALAASPLVPDAYRPPGTPTNLDFLRYALTQSGIDPDRCGIENALRLVGATEPNSFDWYFPTRLKIDLLGAASLGDDPVTRLLGLRLRHLATIDLPLYAFSTGDVPAARTGAQALLAQSRSPRADAVVEHDATMRHSDPLCAPLGRSPFLRTLVPWLKKR